MNTDIDLIFADASIIIANKPSGLLTVPGRGTDKADCLAVRIADSYPDALSVHRLDMATSGLVVLARGKGVQRQLSIQFLRHTVSKTYVAVVEGKVSEHYGEIDLPLMQDWPNRPRSRIDFIAGKASVTRFRRLSCSMHSSRLELEPVTGRTHQLRLHLKAIGHPILGDTLYATPETTMKHDRLMLHATALTFRHPVSDALLSFRSEAPF
jgi:tRNA pseudouridine32 synthase/23S rRNA pseudouridine746 synthase